MFTVYDMKLRIVKTCLFMLNRKRKQNRKPGRMQRELRERDRRRPRRMNWSGRRERRYNSRLVTVYSYSTRVS